MKMRMSDERTWPRDVVACLDEHRSAFYDWEFAKTVRYSTARDVAAWERAHEMLRQVLNQHSLHGYHCTRLTEREASVIVARGMRPSHETFLRERIAALIEDAAIDAATANRLLADHQAGERNRTNMIWFCFYPPSLAGYHGIFRFFRCWGGEALYLAHEEDPLLAPILGRIGTPCLVEAHIPMKLLNEHSFLCDVVARNYLIRRGLKTREHRRHEDYATKPIPPEQIVRIIRYPETRFLELTGCRTWNHPISAIA